MKNNLFSTRVERGHRPVGMLDATEPCIPNFKKGFFCTLTVFSIMGNSVNSPREAVTGGENLFFAGADSHRRLAVGCCGVWVLRQAGMAHRCLSSTNWRRKEGAYAHIRTIYEISFQPNQYWRPLYTNSPPWYEESSRQNHTSLYDLFFPILLDNFWEQDSSGKGTKMDTGRCLTTCLLLSLPMAKKESITPGPSAAGWRSRGFILYCALIAS